jgi:predicted nucleotidyltransferase
MNYTFETVKDELSTLTRVISEAVPVEEIYLFGSYAYGKPGKDSDLDLYVVLKDDIQMRELDALDAINLAIGRKQTMSIDVLALKHNKFIERKEYATIERKIAREGIKLYG